MGSVQELDVSAASTLAHGGSLPELLLSLSYNEMTGRLMVEVVKGSHFKNMTMTKPPGIFDLNFEFEKGFFAIEFYR